MSNAPRYEDLFVYLDALGKTGRLKRTSIDLARSTLKRVLEATDVTIDTVLDDLDIDQIRSQLESLDLKSSTAEAYAGRLRRMVKESRAWAAGEPLKKPEEEKSMIDYPLQLRPGMRLSFSLPADLTPAEASRIGRFLSELVVDEPVDEPAEPSASDSGDGTAEEQAA
ncbi:hypothetical protein AB0I28_06465 [Phytomonospora sp. NPDC050363]|uniref:hypothetical protein n=1 Tax=Phytomonospora sp. NPDC050363 TaxID=3155642 RepID=UPI0033DCAAED